MLHTPAADSAAALAVALPILTNKGLSSHLTFVKANSITTLSSIIDLVSAPQMAPYLPAVVQALLESLSNLESSAFNRVAMAAEARGMDAGNLDEKRVALSSQTPMHSSLQRCSRLVSEESVEAVVLVLTNIIRRGTPRWCRAGPHRASWHRSFLLCVVCCKRHKRNGSSVKMQVPALASVREPQMQQSTNLTNKHSRTTQLRRRLGNCLLLCVTAE